MTQYIDKSALVSEIKRRYEFHEERNRMEDSAIQDVLYGILNFLDTLEVKEVDLQEESVSEDLEEAARSIRDKLYLEEGKRDEFGNPYFLQNTILKAVIMGAKWQKQQDQSAIELAEDHAMLAGMEKMKEQMTAKAVVTTFNVSLPCGVYDKLEAKGCKEGDKLLVIKED
jgi:glucan phosphorylase